ERERGGLHGPGANRPGADLTATSRRPLWDGPGGRRRATKRAQRSSAGALARRCPRHFENRDGWGRRQSSLDRRANRPLRREPCRDRGPAPSRRRAGRRVRTGRPSGRKPRVDPAMNWVAAAQRRRTAIFLVLAVLAAAGVFEAFRLPASIFPDVTCPVVKVIPDVGEEPAEHMMPAVTRPLEEAFHRVPGAIGVLSTTSRGESEIRVQFEWGTDMRTALQRVEGEVERVR